MTIEQEISALNKIINSGLILSVYPEVDHIDVSIAGVHQPYLIYKFYLNNDDTTKETIFYDLDPLWFVDHHVMDTITKLIPFEHIPIKNGDYQIIVFNKSGKPIFDWEDRLSKMKSGSSGRTDWEQRQKR